MSGWSLYLIRASDNSLYTGITTDVERRFNEHQQGGALAARYLRYRQPLTLCYQVTLDSRPTALKAEYRIKRLSKPAKEALLKQQPDANALLALLSLDQR